MQSPMTALLVPNLPCEIFDLLGHENIKTEIIICCLIFFQLLLIIVDPGSSLPSPRKPAPSPSHSIIHSHWSSQRRIKILVTKTSDQTQQRGRNLSTAIT